MAIRMSPLMGLGAIAQGYEQQQQEAARRRLIEEQLRAQALSRAAQGAIGATLTAPGGIGAGVGSSPYAGLGNLGGGGSGGGDPINAPPPGSAPNVSYDSGDSYGNAPKSNATSQGVGDPTQTADAGVTDLPIEAGTPQPSTPFLPDTDQDIPMWMRQGVGAGGMRWQPGQGYVPPQFQQQAAPQQQRPPIVPPRPMPPQPPGQFRNLSPQAANAPPILTPQPAGGYGPGAAGVYVPPGGNQAVNIQGGQPVNPAAGLPPPPAGAAPMTSRIGGGSYARQPVTQPQAPLGGPMPGVPPQRPPMAQPGAQPAAGVQAGGGQQQFNPMDLLNPAKSLDFASQIAMRVKAANPNASNEVIAMATTDLMKSVATQDRVGLALALANMRNITQNRAIDVRQSEGEANRDVRVSEGAANRGVRQSEGAANRDVRTSEGQKNRDARADALKQRLEAQKQRYAQLDAQKEQARKDAMARGDRSTYIRVLTAQLTEIRSQLGNMMRNMEPEEKQAAQAKEKELMDELARVQGQTRPQ